MINKKSPSDGQLGGGLSVIRHYFRRHLMTDDHHLLRLFYSLLGLYCSATIIPLPSMRRPTTSNTEAQ
jgi:hypothetical protein